MNIRRIAKSLSALAAAALVGCVSRYPIPKPADWSRPECWYRDVRGDDPDRVDVFYVPSTEVMASKDAQGRPSPFAALTEEECAALAAEARWFREHIFTEEFDFRAPMYHQVVYEALGAPRGGRSERWDAAADEVCDAFDSYMARENRGRRFILAGFSQGASAIRAVLRHMTDEQYSRMVAAYAIGFQVTAEDLESEHVKPAKGADDTGVIVSFNTVARPEGRWDLLSGDAACSINPVNWCTDGTPAEFELDGKPLLAILDNASHVVFVTGYTPPETKFSRLFPPGNLHGSEMMLYEKSLRENALLRAYGKGKR